MGDDSGQTKQKRSDWSADPYRSIYSHPHHQLAIVSVDDRTVIRAYPVPIYGQTLEDSRRVK